MSGWPRIYYKLLNLPLSILVKSKSIPADPAPELGLDTSRPIMYVLPYNSKADLLTLRAQCLAHDLPDPLEPLEIDGTLLPRYVFIHGGPRVFTYYTPKEESIKLFHDYLDLHRSNPNLDVQMVPVSVMFGRAPGREKGEVNPPLRMLNGVQKFFAVLWLGRDSFVRFSPSVSLRRMADEHGTDKTIAQKLALSKLLETAEPHAGKALYCTENNPPFDNGLLNAQLLQQAKPFVDERQSKTFWFDIRNTDRSVGASLSGYIAQTHGDQGLAADPIKAYFNGTAGQSFGVWNAGGVELYLTGDANDYVGKGMAGGLIAIRPPVGSAFRSHEASIIGNTCLYGATGGRLYAAGRAGERFGVRNSGAITVVEGIGDNGCEYMTGGIVCILGKTGVNFGAGMTGGFAYVLDESGDFRKRVNPELVEVLSVDDLAIHEEHLRGLITEHVQHTGSQRGEEILANWSTFATKFALVKPKSSDVKALLGHRSRSAAELRVQAQ